MQHKSKEHKANQQREKNQNHFHSCCVRLDIFFVLSLLNYPTSTFLALIVLPLWYSLSSIHLKKNIEQRRKKKKIMGILRCSTHSTVHLYDGTTMAEMLTKQIHDRKYEEWKAYHTCIHVHIYSEINVDPNKWVENVLYFGRFLVESKITRTHTCKQWGTTAINKCQNNNSK